MNEPIRWDDRSRWEIAPRAAWEVGQGELIRCFDTPEAALAFIAKPPSANAAKQRRYRQRLRDNAAGKIDGLAATLSAVAVPPPADVAAIIA